MAEMSQPTSAPMHMYAPFASPRGSLQLSPSCRFVHVNTAAFVALAEDSFCSPKPKTPSSHTGNRTPSSTSSVLSSSSSFSNASANSPVSYSSTSPRLPHRSSSLFALAAEKEFPESVHCIAMSPRPSVNALDNIISHCPRPPSPRVSRSASLYCRSSGQLPMALPSPEEIQQEPNTVGIQQQQQSCGSQQQQAARTGMPPKWETMAQGNLARRRQTNLLLPELDVRNSVCRSRVTSYNFASGTFASPNVVSRPATTETSPETDEILRSQSAGPALWESERYSENQLAQEAGDGACLTSTLGGDSPSQNRMRRSRTMPLDFVDVIPGTPLALHVVPSSPSGPSSVIKHRHHSGPMASPRSQMHELPPPPLKEMVVAVGHLTRQQSNPLLNCENGSRQRIRWPTLHHIVDQRMLMLLYSYECQ
eukprot:TRINITY_DN7476_c0_g1_i1.p1 TRINITY_DN7476_c0_g1~~TRINITY_DN7476_c0_g1_i1.p1  ORF type:complete len:422 (+),score=13.36 TRINITY_DN7476_c0_g1_i1:36-1301(+)